MKISELCLVERAKPSKVYRAGSCYVRLSAVNESVGQLAAPGRIDSGYAVFEPVGELNMEYLYIAVCRKFPEFLSRYRTTINLKYETLKYFTLDWHENEAEQWEVVRICNMLQREIDTIEKQIAYEKEIKRWYLAKMVINRESY